MKANVKIDSASTGPYRKHIKYVTFPWPPAVAAHVSMRLERALHSSGRYWL